MRSSEAALVTLREAMVERVDPPKTDSRREIQEILFVGKNVKEMCTLFR